MAQERRTSSSPDSAVERRRASEAMQRAANAMIAATESFRQQFHQRQASLPRPGHKARQDSADSSSSSSSLLRGHSREDERDVDSSGALAPSTRPSTSWLAEAGGSSGSSGDDAPYRTFPFISAASALRSHPVLVASPLDARPISPPSPPPKTPTSPQSVPRTPSSANSLQKSLPPLPKPDWEALSRKPRKIAPIIAPQRPRHVRQATRQSSHVDLVEAAASFSASRQAVAYHQLQSPASPPYSGYPEQQQLPPANARDDVRRPLIANRIPRKPIGSAPGGPNLPPDRFGPPGMSLRDEIAFVATICVAQGLMWAGFSQALVPARLIGESFAQTTRGALAWYTAAYGLTAGTLVLPAGRVGDLFGHKRVFVAGFLWFALWSFLAGLAKTLQNSNSNINGTAYFCLCRAMQGIGPALLVPNGRAMLERAYGPDQRKALMLCFVDLAAPLGFVLGAVFASLLAINSAWEWAFFVLAAVDVAMAGLSILVLPGTNSPSQKASLRAKSVADTAEDDDAADDGISPDSGTWERLDGLGASLGVSGLVLVNVAWNQAPIVGWTTPYTYFVLLMGAMLLAAFGYVEAHTRFPLVPLSAMRSSAGVVLFCAAAGWGCFGVWVVNGFAFLETQRGWGPLLAAGAHVHLVLAGFAATFMAFAVLSRLRWRWRAHWVLLVAMCAFAVGSVLMATAPVGQTFWLGTFFSILVVPFGMGMANSAATVLLGDGVSREYPGLAARLVDTAVGYSLSVALGMAGTVESAILEKGGDALAGIRAAQYFGVGLGGLGGIVAAAFVLLSYLHPRDEADRT